MKKLFLALAIFCVGAVKASPVNKIPAAVSPLGTLLVELESNMGWIAVEDNWKTARTPWAAATTACPDAACVAMRLLELESNTKWVAVDTKWAARREGWVTECKAAKTNAAAAKLVMEFEAYVKWDAVYPTWKKRREAWLAEVKAIK